jgi:hypothetical protein
MNKIIIDNKFVVKISLALIRFVIAAGLVLTALSCVLSALNVKYFMEFKLPENLRGNFNLMYVLVFLFVAAREDPWNFFLSCSEKTAKVMDKKGFFPFMSAAMFIIYLVTAASGYLSLNYNSFAGLMERIVYNSYNGKFLFYDLTGKSYLAEHLSFAPVYFIPFHFVIRSIISMLLICVISLWAGGIILRDILKTEGHGNAVTNFVCLIYFNSQIIISNIGVGFEQLIVPGVLFMYCCYLKKWHWGYWAALVFVLTLKEDLALYSAGFALYAIIKDKRQHTGVLTLAASLAWFFSSFYVWLPAFAGEHGYKFLNSNYSQWGRSLGEIALSFTMHPLKLIQAMLSPVYLQFFSSLALLPFFKAGGILIFINAWIVCAASANIDQNQIRYYYGIGLFVFTILAAVAGLNTALFREKLGRETKVILAAMVLVLNVGWFSFSKFDFQVLDFIKTLNTIPPGSSVTAGYYANAYVKKDSSIVTWAGEKIDTDYIVLTWRDIRLAWRNIKKNMPKDKYVNISTYDKCYIFKKINRDSPM